MSIAQTLLQDAVIDILARTRPCTMDDVVGALPNHNWNEVFIAVDEMSRDGRVVLRRLSESGYQLSLSASCQANRRARRSHALVRFCMGCGYLCDEIQLEGGETQWLEAHCYLQKYGLTWNMLDRREDICPACARVLACGRRGDRPHAVA